MCCYVVGPFLSVQLGGGGGGGVLIPVLSLS